MRILIKALVIIAIFIGFVEMLPKPQKPPLTPVTFIRFPKEPWPKGRPYYANITSCLNLTSWYDKRRAWEYDRMVRNSPDHKLRKDYSDCKLTGKKGGPSLRIDRGLR